jgi:hypothetical protein
MFRRKGYPYFVVLRLRKLRIAIHFKNRTLLQQMLFKSTRPLGLQTAELREGDIRRIRLRAKSATWIIKEALYESP